MNARARPTTGLNHEIVGVIQEIMDRESLKNTDLSARSGVPTSSIYRYMNEERAFSLSDLEKVSKSLNLRTSSLLARAEANLSAQNSAPPALPSAPPLNPFTLPPDVTLAAHDDMYDPELEEYGLQESP